MKIVIGDRRSGKTTEAVEWLKEASNRVLIVDTGFEKERIIDEFSLLEWYEERWVKVETNRVYEYYRERPVPMSIKEARAEALRVLKWNPVQIPVMTLGEIEGGALLGRYAEPVELFVDNADDVFLQMLWRYGKLKGMSLTDSGEVVDLRKGEKRSHGEKEPEHEA